MSCRTRFLTAAFMVPVCLALVAPAHAAGPSMMHYQGFLRDNAGIPVTTSVDLTFKVFDAATSGTELWSETHNGVVPTDGVFNVVLGSTTPLVETLFDATDRWLETSVDGTPLTPRRQFLNTPYAMRAAVADVALSGGGSDTDWTENGSDVYRTTGNVGIGTATPAQQLHIDDGNMNLDAADFHVNTNLIVESRDAIVDIVSNSDGVSGSILQFSETNTANDAIQEQWSISKRTVGGGGTLNFAHTNAGTVLQLDPAGEVNLAPDATDRVGIGTTSPGRKLDVQGDARAENFEATTALTSGVPVTGGVYANNVVYAWVNFDVLTLTHVGYGIDNVQKDSQGVYRVYLEKELPGGAAASLTVSSNPDPLVIGTCTLEEIGTQTTVLVKINKLSGTPGPQDSDFYLMVVGTP